MFTLGYRRMHDLWDRLFICEYWLNKWSWLISLVILHLRGRDWLGCSNHLWRQHVRRSQLRRRRQLWSSYQLWNSQILWSMWSSHMLSRKLRVRIICNLWSWLNLRPIHTLLSRRRLWSWQKAMPQLCRFGSLLPKIYLLLEQPYWCFAFLTFLTTYWSLSIFYVD